MISRLGLRAMRPPRPLMPAARYIAFHPTSASIYTSSPSSPPSAPSPGSPASPGAPPRPAEEDLLALGLHPSDYGPRPEDIPPISERLKPMIPFILIWTVITSLAMHLLRVRKQGEAQDARCAAQESVVLGLIARFEAGEVVSDTEIRRELEMVGLRARTMASAGFEVEEMREVSWWEVIRGRREQRAKRVERERVGEEGGEEAAVEEWSKSESRWAKRGEEGRRGAKGAKDGEEGEEGEDGRRREQGERSKRDGKRRTRGRREEERERREGRGGVYEHS